MAAIDCRARAFVFEFPDQLISFDDCFVNEWMNEFQIVRTIICSAGTMECEWKLTKTNIRCGTSKIRKFKWFACNYSCSAVFIQQINCFLFVWLTRGLVSAFFVSFSLSNVAQTMFTHFNLHKAKRNARSWSILVCFCLTDEKSLWKRKIVKQNSIK